MEHFCGNGEASLSQRAGVTVHCSRGRYLSVSLRLTAVGRLRVVVTSAWRVHF
jgi:hypothetical protein